MSRTQVHLTSKKEVAEITAKVRQKFRCFGGGYYMPGNPISLALAEHAPQFAAGVDVAEVVAFVLHQSRKKP